MLMKRVEAYDKNNRKYFIDYKVKQPIAVDFVYTIGIVTNKYELLVIGTNLGGLGTIIASMASLISFKYIGKEYKELRGRYLLNFTVTNLLFLAVLMLVNMFLL